jgi:hypothetical protein
MKKNSLLQMMEESDKHVYGLQSIIRILSIIFALLLFSCSGSSTNSPSNVIPFDMPQGNVISSQPIVDPTFTATPFLPVGGFSSSDNRQEDLGVSTPVPLSGLLPRYHRR